MLKNKVTQSNELHSLIVDCTNKHPHNYEFTILKYRWEHIKAVLIENITIPPYEIEIQPSSICNLSCIWCVGSGIQRIRETKKLDNLITEQKVDSLADNIINYQVGKFKVDTIKLSGFVGDPLIEKKVTSRLIKRFHAAKRRIGLFTNGIYLNDPEIMDLITCIDYLHISLDAGSPQTFCKLKLMGLTDTNCMELFDKIINNIIQISNIRDTKNSELEITVGYILTSQNYHEVFELAKRLKDIGVNRMRFRNDLLGLHSLKEDQKDAIYHELFERIEDELIDDDFKITIQQEVEYDIKKIENLVCRSHFLWGTVGSDGSVYPCNHCTFFGAHNYGNVLNRTFRDIWEGKQRQTIYESLPSKNNCIRCSPFAHKINIFLDKLITLIETNGIEKVEEWRNEICLDK